jgi:GNAT superfamily N-acetyltransferase
LAIRGLEAPLTKRFPLDDLESPTRPYDQAWVASVGEVIVGFAGSSFEVWNKRLVLWHLYVDPAHRRQGIARQLLEAVEAEGVSRGARHLWLETSSLNVPGVAAYRALGFSLTGADLTLYDGTPAEGEAALFFSRHIAGTTRSRVPARAMGLTHIADDFDASSPTIQALFEGAADESAAP